jgi:hypothetical protein
MQYVYARRWSQDPREGLNVSRIRARGNDRFNRHSQFFVPGVKWNSEKGRPLSGARYYFEGEWLNCENEGAVVITLSFLHEGNLT